MLLLNSSKVYQGLSMSLKMQQEKFTNYHPSINPITPIQLISRKETMKMRNFWELLLISKLPRMKTPYLFVNLKIKGEACWTRSMITINQDRLKWLIEYQIICLEKLWEKPPWPPKALIQSWWRNSCKENLPRMINLVLTSLTPWLILINVLLFLQKRFKVWVKRNKAVISLSQLTKTFLINQIGISNSILNYKNNMDHRTTRGVAHS